MRITSSNFHLISALAVVVLLLGFVVWAIFWYSSAGNQNKFTPGDIGSAFNIFNVLITCVIAYYARLAFSSSQQQLVEMQKDRRSQHITDAVTEALQQFRQRRDRNADVFIKALDSACSFLPDDGAKVKDERRGNFRTANYILKPLSYCCDWMLSQQFPDCDDEYKATLHISALRMLGELSSAEHVYLILASKLKIDDIVLEHEGFRRRYEAHCRIHEFMTSYAFNDFSDCESANPGQIAKIEKMMREHNWADNISVRRSFFF